MRDFSGTAPADAGWANSVRAPARSAVPPLTVAPTLVEEPLALSPLQVMSSTGIKSGYVNQFRLNNAEDGSLYSAFMARSNCGWLHLVPFEKPALPPRPHETRESRISEPAPPFVHLALAGGPVGRVPCFCRSGTVFPALPSHRVRYHLLARPRLIISTTLQLLGLPLPAPFPRPPGVSSVRPKPCRPQDHRRCSRLREPLVRLFHLLPLPGTRIRPPGSAGSFASP